jgi:transcriptional regulator with GAF, ATPase, and Fis domain
LSLLNKYIKIQEELGIIGKSEKIRELVELIYSVAPTNISVLISGESGVGKEVFAKAIHELSPRRDKPMISFNCGAIPEGLLESELFGHEKGAFTGAINTKKGYFELADKSTIFLDEIGEMPIQTQVKLLRVLETGEFMRVGSGELRKVDVHIIAASNRDLGEMVKKRQFRKDLFYRLKAVSLYVPPLRERKEDISLLIDHFLQETLKKNDIEFAGFTDDARNLLYNYSWPGNVREVKNLVETVVVLARGQKVSSDMVREHLQYYEDQKETNYALPVPSGRTVEQAERELVYKALVSLGVEVREMKNLLMRLSDRLNGDYARDMIIAEAQEDEEIKPIDELEREMIEKALHRYQGNRRRAARALNMSERTLYRKIKEYDLG